MKHKSGQGNQVGENMKDSVQQAELTEEQRARYARNILLEEVGEEGQKKLLSGSVLIIGAGGLGAPAALYLAAAGVGTIGIADADRVELSNLQRQIIHGTEDLGRAKTASAGESMRRINPDVTVHAYSVFVTQQNLPELVRQYDFVVDATVNFKTKFLINDVCVAEKKPFVLAGILRFEGQLMTYVPGEGPCYRCVFGGEPPEGAVEKGSETGIIGAVAGVIGSLQALEAVKYILGVGEMLTGRLLTFDALTMETRIIRLPERTPDCPACGAAKESKGNLPHSE